MTRRDAPVALEDVLAAAKLLATAERRDIAAMARIAWVVRNRARQSLARRRAGGRGAFGDGSIAAAARSLADPPRRESAVRDVRIRLRAAGVMCLVLSGDIPDPTSGAVSCDALRTQ